mmetsp:Transcript_13873/g.40656  ORF Transcript_13873/g.40656 Transcript_13873/m.40656 type:complete len:208 (-) Transcript_13873:260-883(-)
MPEVPGTTERSCVRSSTSRRPTRARLASLATRSETLSRTPPGQRSTSSSSSCPWSPSLSPRSFASKTTRLTPTGTTSTTGSSPLSCSSSSLASSCTPRSSPGRTLSASSLVEKTRPSKWPLPRQPRARPTTPLHPKMCRSPRRKPKLFVCRSWTASRRGTHSIHQPATSRGKKVVIGPHAWRRGKTCVRTSEPGVLSQRLLRDNTGL